MDGHGWLPDSQYRQAAGAAETAAVLAAVIPLIWGMVAEIERCHPFASPTESRAARSRPNLLGSAKCEMPFY
jgi:hypothetical protein